MAPVSFYGDFLKLTIAEAKRTFAEGMKVAREGRLSEAGRRQLSQARQVLRRARRPAMNAQKHLIPSISEWHVYAGGTSAREGAYSYVWRVPGHPTAQISIDPLPFPARRGYSVNTFAIPSHTSHRQHGTVASPAQGVTLARKIWDEAQSTNPHRPARASGYPVRKNPTRDLVRLGRTTEIRYKRDIGSKRGFYKHEFRTARANLYTISKGWVYVPGKAIVITEGRPHV